MTFLLGGMTLTLALFLLFSHPFPLVIILIFQTTMLILKMVLMSESPWLSFITFLIYLGGLLIIFVYLSAIIPNEMLYINKTGYFFMFMPIFFVIFNEGGMSKNSLFFMNFFSPHQNMSTVPFLLLYIMLMLCILMYLCLSTKNPLKQNNY